MNKDVARRALKHAVVKNASITSTTIDSARSCRSVTPPSPCCHTSLSYDVLPTTPCDDLGTKQLADIFAQSSEAGQQHVCDDQISSYVDRVACSNDGLPTDQGAYFLPLCDTRSPHKQKPCRRRASTLDDIDEALDETALVFHSRHSVLDLRQHSQQPIIAWSSDDECDDKDEVEATKQQRDVREVCEGGDVQTQLTRVADCTDTGRHQSTRSPNSEPAVSLHQHRATRSVNCTPVAGGVQSDFVLSSTTRPLPAVGPREAVCKMRTEGDPTVCCPLSSTVCSRLNDCVLPADMSGDCRHLQRTAKVSSKLNDVGVLPVGGVHNECLAMNNDLTCYRVEEQVVHGKPSCRERTRATSNGTTNNGSGTLRTSAGKIQSVHTATNSGASAVREVAETTTTDDNTQTQTQARRESDSKQVNTETSSHSQVPKTQETFEHDDSSVSNNRSGWESSPDTVKLLAVLINKISELATRQDQLEGITTTSRCVKKDKSVSQTDERRREAGDGSGLSQVISTSAAERSSILRSNNRQQVQANLDDARQSVASRQDETLLKTTRKERCTNKSQKSEQRMSNDQQTNNIVSEEILAVHSAMPNDDTSEPSKLNNSSSHGQQSDDVNDTVEHQQPPPTGSMKPSPSSAVTDNIIHIVRGSRALDDLTVEELMRHYTELFNPVSDEVVAHGGQPVKETETSTEGHSQQLQDQAADESLSRVNNEPPQRYQGPKSPQHASRQSPRLKSQNSVSQQPKTTQDDRQVSRRPRCDRRTPQHADNVSAQQRRDPHTTQDDPQQSSRPRHGSTSPKDVANSASSSRHFTQQRGEHQPVQGVKRPRTERCQQKQTSQHASFNASDDHAKLRMQYVSWRSL